MAEDELGFVAVLQAADESLHLPESFGRDKDMGAGLEHAEAGKVPECQAVGVGGGQPQTLVGRLHQHAGELRRP